MMTENSTAAPEINRRRFLLNTATAGAALALAAPAVAAEQEMTVREQAIWHMRELERLAKSTGAETVSVMVVGHSYGGKAGYEHCKSIQIMAGDRGLIDLDHMFDQKGVAA